MSGPIPVYEIEIEYDGGLITNPKLFKSEDEATTYAEEMIKKLKDEHPDWHDFKFRLRPGTIDSKLMS